MLRTIGGGGRLSDGGHRMPALVLSHFLHPFRSLPLSDTETNRTRNARKRPCETASFKRGKVGTTTPNAVQRRQHVRYWPPTGFWARFPYITDNSIPSNGKRKVFCLQLIYIFLKAFPKRTLKKKHFKNTLNLLFHNLHPENRRRLQAKAAFSDRHRPSWQFFIFRL